MKKNQLLLVSFCIGMIAQMLLIQCESPKKAVREKADESGKESTWNADIRQNSDDMLEKGDYFVGNKNND